MPHVKQLSVFIPNRLGALNQLVARLEEEPVRICAISILDAADHAVVRMVVNRPAVAKTALAEAGIPVFETPLLGVALPEKSGAEVGIRRVLTALLAAEVKVEYIYALIIRVDERPILALHVDDMPLAAKVLADLGLDLIAQEDLGWADEPG